MYSETCRALRFVPDIKLSNLIKFHLVGPWLGPPLTLRLPGQFFFKRRAVAVDVARSPGAWETHMHRLIQLCCSNVATTGAKCCSRVGICDVKTYQFQSLMYIQYSRPFLCPPGWPGVKLMVAGAVGSKWRAGVVPSNPLSDIAI